MSATSKPRPDPAVRTPILDTGELLRRYAALRDPRDLDALSRRFRPLARRLAMRYAGSGDALEDLEQVANLGLVKALRRFEPDRGFAFTSYAVPTILGELKRSFRDTAWAAHVPRAMQERSSRVRDAAEKLEGVLGRPATVREIARALEEPAEDVLEALGAVRAQNALSLDAPVHGDEDADVTLADHIGGRDDGYERAEDLAAIAEALPALTSMQREVLALRFEGDLLQSEIATRLGVSQMQVSRVLRSAVERLHTIADHRSRLPARAA